MWLFTKCIMVLSFQAHLQGVLLWWNSFQQQIRVMCLTSSSIAVRNMGFTFLTIIFFSFFYISWPDRVPIPIFYDTNMFARTWSPLAQIQTPKWSCCLFWISCPRCSKVRCHLIYVCVCACIFVCACTCACVHGCMLVWLCVCVFVHVIHVLFLFVFFTITHVCAQEPVSSCVLCIYSFFLFFFWVTSNETQLLRIKGLPHYTYIIAAAIR